MWDVSVGGHIMAKENDIEAVKRELKEELGIDSNSISFVKKIKEELNNKNINNKEIVSIFILYQDIDINKLVLQKEEVSNAKWITKEELELMIKEKKVIPHHEEYEIIKNIIK